MLQVCIIILKFNIKYSVRQPGSTEKKSNQEIRNWTLRRCERITCWSFFFLFSFVLCQDNPFALAVEINCQNCSQVSHALFARAASKDYYLKKVTQSVAHFSKHELLFISSASLSDRSLRLYNILHKQFQVRNSIKTMSN